MKRLLFLGVGGGGGSVFLEADEKATFSKVLSLYADRRVKAGNGGHSAQHMLLGKAGQDVTVHVPLGVAVVDSDNKVMGEYRSRFLENLTVRVGRGEFSRSFTVPS